MVGRVFVGGLPEGVRERDLERFFKKFGRITDIFIKYGYSFVNFESSRDANDAVSELHMTELMGRKVSVELARSKGEWKYSRHDRYRFSGRRERGDRQSGRFSSRYGRAFSTEYRVIVKNLSGTIDWKSLKDFMRQAGEVTYTDAHSQRRNEGVCDFASASDMKNAIRKLNNTKLNGRRIELIEASGQRGGNYRKSRSRTRSRSRSRSRSLLSSSSSSHLSNRSSISKSSRRSKTLEIRNECSSPIRQGNAKKRGHSTDSGSSAMSNQSKSKMHATKMGSNSPNKKRRSEERSRSMSRSSARDDTKQRNSKVDRESTSE